MTYFTRRDYDRAEDEAPGLRSQLCDHGVTLLDDCQFCTFRPDRDALTPEQQARYDELLNMHKEADHDDAMLYAETGWYRPAPPVPFPAHMMPCIGCGWIDCDGAHP